MNSRLVCHSGARGPPTCIFAEKTVRAPTLHRTRARTASPPSSGSCACAVQRVHPSGRTSMRLQIHVLRPFHHPTPLHSSVGRAED
eukprot:5600452-Prymnesium_polylepis.1